LTEWHNIVVSVVVVLAHLPRGWVKPRYLREWRSNNCEIPEKSSQIVLKDVIFQVFLVLWFGR